MAKSGGNNPLSSIKKATKQVGKFAGEAPKDKLLPQKEFLEKYNIDKKVFQDTGIKWSDLEIIFKDFIKKRDALNLSGQSVVSVLFSPEAKDSGVHSVKYRIKDPQGLIEKIIRRKVDNPTFKNLTVDDYQKEIIDIIGVRALHVFKQDWYGVGNFIKSTWDLKSTHKKPTVWYREGDDLEFLKKCKENNCIIKPHPKGYRSIHYIIQLNATKETHYVEIQVRTIFEEGWSEIDHKIRYSSKKKNEEHPLQGYLLILNTISGSADDLGKQLKHHKTNLEIEQNVTKKKTGKKGGKNA